MSWTLSASGHADNPDDETALAGRIGSVLAEAGAAVSSATFSGSSLSGDPRDLAPVRADGDEPS